MQIYMYYFFAAVIALWAYRLCVYHYGDSDPKTNRARTARRKGYRY